MWCPRTSRPSVRRVRFCDWDLNWIGNVRQHQCVCMRSLFLRMRSGSGVTGVQTVRLPATRTCCKMRCLAKEHPHTRFACAALWIFAHFPCSVCDYITDKLSRTREWKLINRRGEANRGPFAHGAGARRRCSTRRNVRACANGKPKLIIKI